jgi:hypothetical protein
MLLAPRCLRAVLPLLLACLIAAPAFAQELRQWSDASGKFKIKAKFKGETDGVVTLEQEDGEEIEIELKKLSATDQRLITALKKDSGGDSPFKKKDDDPFKSKSKTGKSKSGSTSASSKKPKEPEPEPEPESTVEIPDTPRNIEVTWGGAETLAAVGISEWGVKLEEFEPIVEGKRKNVALPPKADFFEKLSGIAINHPAKKAAALFTMEKPGGGPAVTRAVMCDLVSGKAGTIAQTEGHWVPLTVHDDGQQIVVRSNGFGSGKNNQLEVWVLRGARVAKIATMYPFKSVGERDQDIAWAAFVDENSVALCSSGGRVALCSYPDFEPRWFIDGKGGSVPALSPDRKLIAVGTEDGVAVIDLAKQEVIAAKASPEKMHWPHFAFSPSGKKLGVVAHEQVYCWNTETGALENEIPANGAHFGGGLSFPDDKYLLAGNHLLLDLENQLQFWDYSGQEQTAVRGDLTFFAVTDGQRPGLLMNGKLPHPPALDTLDKALKSGDLFIFKEGSKVKLNLDAITDAGVRDRAIKAFTTRLAAMKVTIDNSADVEIIASISGPKSREVRYHGFGLGGGGTYNVQEYISSYSFNYQGKPVWSSHIGTNVPHFVNLKQGESMESYLRAREKPEYGIFETPRLPKFIQKPGEGTNPFTRAALGTSRVSTGGFR